MYGSRKNPNVIYTWTRQEKRDDRDDTFYAILFILLIAILVASILLMWAYTL